METPGSSAAQIENQKRVLALGIFIILSIGIAVALNRYPAVRYRSDLFSRWYAARQLLQTQRNIYDIRNGEEAAAFKSTPTSALEAGFFYPAHLLILVAPLSLLPFEIANPLWTAALLIFLVLGTWLVSGRLDWPGNANRLAVYLLLALLYIPTLQNAIWSQFDAIAALGLALCYLALRQGSLFQAGAWAAGLTFKPQVALFTLFFLLLWAGLRRERWKFVAGFAAAALLLWLFAQALQPGWIADFLTALGEYRQLPYTIRSTLDRIWNPGQAAAISLLLACSGLFILHRNVPASDPRFAASIALSLAAGWLATPVIGMLHLVVLPVGLVFLLASVESLLPDWHRPAWLGFLAIYLLGAAGFLYGLMAPGAYGLHIELAELAYKTGLSIAMVFLAASVLVKNFELRRA